MGARHPSPQTPAGSTASFCTATADSDLGRTFVILRIRPNGVWFRSGVPSGGVHVVGQSGVFTMSAWVTRWRWMLAGGLVLVAAGVVVAALVWPSSAPAGPHRPPLRARSYNAFTVCLLTGPQGIAGASARPVWAGVEAASNETSDQAQYLAATGSPETVDSVTPFVDSLVQQQCGVIVAVGPLEVLAAQSAAAQNKSTTFILVGGGSTESNVRVENVISQDATTAAIETAIGDH